MLQAKQKRSEARADWRTRKGRKTLHHRGAKPARSSRALSAGRGLWRYSATIRVGSPDLVKGGER